jgi:hypothetical protein
LEAITGKNPQKVNSYIEEVVTLMGESSAYFESVATDIESASSAADYSFDEGFVNRRVQEARNRLDQAEPLATDEQRVNISALREWLDVHEAQAGLVTAFVDGAQSIDRALAFKKTQDYESSLNEIDVAESDFNLAQRSIEIVRKEFEDLNDEDLSGITRIQYSDLESNIEANEAKIPAFQQRVELYRAQIKGNRDLFTGVDQITAGNHGLASETLETASGHYADAQEITESLLAEQGDEKYPSLIRVECRTSNYGEASQLLSEAATAFESGDISDGNGLQGQAREKLGESC